MNIDEALSFLIEETPLPPDEQLTDDLIDRYEEARRVFLNCADERCIAPLLGSFGDGSGFGVYQLVEDVIARFPEDVVVPLLARSLASPRQGVKYWCSQLVSRFPSRLLLTPITINLRDERPEIRIVSADALGFIKDKAAIPSLEEALATEADEDVIKAFRELIDELERDDSNYDLPSASADMDV